MGQFLIATNEILHLLSIEETSGENKVRYSLGLPKNCGCRHAGTRGAPTNVRTCFLSHGLKRDARETVCIFDKEALQEHRIYVWRFSILCIHIGG